MRPHVITAAADSVAAQFVGVSTFAQRLRQTVVHAAPLTIPVHITGPSGAGKEVVAELLHSLSRRTGAFVAVNAASIPTDLVESILCGHARGAFTGASDRTNGVVEDARGGTLFLDEIASASRATQGALLRILDGRPYRPVGGGPERQPSCRIVSASNESLADAVREGVFRRDLYYRLVGVELALIPLRDRRDDIGPIADVLLARAAAASGYQRRLSAAARQRLEHEPWPGNVRQLRWVIERAVAFAKRDEIKEVDLGLRDAPEPAPVSPHPLAAQLAEHGFDVRRLAAHHGVHPATVYRWLEAEGIEAPRRSAARRGRQ
ncbi:MAG: sigma 54-interacting transcriptional regulator [Gemmatimonadaceae bacterium]|nr:sigma 54-interacting transcriptional regulator [Gemmatimonadaceae bacterium]